MADKSVAIMQPYFFPYLGYFSLIAATDLWIFFDTAQYIRHGWVNRNRILKPSKDDWQYITVPLEKHARDTPIKDIIPKSNGWQTKMLAQLEHYKKAPFYNQVIELVREVIMSQESEDSIAELNVRCIEYVCNYLKIDFYWEVFSEMDLDVEKVSAPDEWALNICKEIGIKRYINSLGGLDFFDIRKYEQQGIEIEFIRNSLLRYPQPSKDFIRGLSIIDVMMFNEQSTVKKMVYNYNIEKS